MHYANAWAMILNDDGTVIWEDGLPEELPRKYTATDIAMFSRWYLDDYPVNIWKRAKAICQKSEKLRSLIADLNLTTKLEYSMYALKKNAVNAVELIRQVASEFLNELPEQYEIEIVEDSPGKPVLLNGDDFLLYRMLRNLVGNSITHNPDGCKISLYVGSDVDCCLFEISDTGCGIATPQLSLLNGGMPISSTQEENNVTEHGLGHKIVRQIVKIHHGKLYFLKNSPHGLIVKISLPLK